MFDRTNHGYPPSFDVPEYFFALCFHDFYQIGKFQVSFKVVV